MTRPDPYASPGPRKPWALVEYTGGQVYTVKRFYFKWGAIWANVGGFYHLVYDDDSKGRACLSSPEP